MLSNGYLPPGTLKKPAHCSKVLGPNRETESSSSLSPKGPSDSRFATILAATDGLIPATYDSRGTDAVFRSTPTRFTADSTTPLSVVLSSLPETSC